MARIDEVLVVLQPIAVFYKTDGVVAHRRMPRSTTSSR
jgi:hypothetical protein